MHSATPHPQQYCKGERHLPPRMHSAASPPPSQQILHERALASRMHSATLLNKENIMAVIDLRMTSLINSEKEEEGDSNFAEHLITIITSSGTRQSGVEGSNSQRITSIPGNVLEWTMQNASLQKEGI
ncbi:hypothetical protein LSTR_LSTR008165 [Laodelphax striatellus]|uniref:Uncharacterized protein n=1 Tax=Laodelphax striatellus TaxID=195883 RepID=A0A482WZ33_LAOST|nr:hypothetical protein LSTR_LSTR008165 [Laodelphax striatellus]